MHNIETLPKAEAVLCFSHIGTRTGKVTAEECYMKIDAAWKEFKGFSLEHKIRSMLSDGNEIDATMAKTEDHVVSELLAMFGGEHNEDAVTNIIAISDCINWMAYKHHLSKVTEQVRKAMIAEMEDRQRTGDYEYIPDEYRQPFLANLQSIVLPSYIHRITQNFFSGFSGIEEVTIPESIDAIEYRAFADCSSLKNVIFPSSLRELSSGAFVACKSLENIIVAEGNDDYFCTNNCVVRKSDMALILGCKSSIIPEGVTRINYEAFACCTGLTSIDFPESLIEIGNSAFAYCNNLKEIVIPESVELIDIRAFRHCKSLETITIVGCPKIEYEAFSECWNVKTVECLSDKLIYAHPTSFHITEEVAKFDLKSDIYWSSDGYEPFE